MTGRKLEEYDLGHLPTLEPELESFLETPTPMWGAEDRCDSQLEPSIENYEVWLEWQDCQVDMPDWWGELVTIPNTGDPEMLGHKMHTSFKIPQVRSEALKDSNSYTVPPAPKCLQRKMFLPVPNPHLPCQDYCLKQLLRTLVYAQALQYWAEKANLLGPHELCCLAMCVHELRWVMRPYITFSNCHIFECLTCESPEAEVKEATQLHPAILTPTPDPRPSIPRPDEPAALTFVPVGLANELPVTTTPLEAANNVDRAKDKEYPNWTEIHPSHPTASVGCTPPTLGDLGWHLHTCSSSWRRAHCNLMEEQQGSKDDSTSASPWRDPSPEASGAQPKMPPWALGRLPGH